MIAEWSGNNEGGRMWPVMPEPDIILNYKRLKTCFQNRAMSIMKSKVNVCSRKVGKNIHMPENFDCCREMNVQKQQ